eukprot:512029_1
MHFTRLLSTFLLLICTTLGCSSPSDNEATTIITPNKGDITYGGGAQWVDAPSSDGGSIRSGNPGGESFAESSYCFSSSRKTISSISISYRYTVGYASGTPPSMNLILQPSVGESWSAVVNPSFNGEYSFDAHSGSILSYSDDVTKTFSDLSMAQFSGKQLNFKLTFSNHDRNVHILNGFTITVTWIPIECDFKPFTSMYNQAIVDHLYTINTEERSVHWVVEGTEGRLSSTHCEGTVPLYRYWRNDIAYGQDHMYSIDQASAETLKIHRYIEEGIAGYCFESQYVGTVPLYQYYNYQAPNGDHLYTINTFPNGINGYTFVRIECYVKPSHEWTDTEWSAFPYMVLVKDCSPSWACGQCGGSILSLDGIDGKGAILTAAHCARGSNIFIHIGTTDTHCCFKPGVKTYNVINKKIGHQMFTGGGNNDIAILYLDSAITHPDAVAIELESDINNIPNNARLTAVGYGGSCTNPNICIAPSDLDTLEYAFTNFVTKEECLAQAPGGTTPGAYIICVKDMFMSDGYTTVCSGDSGSPLIYNNKQIGIVQSTIGTQQGSICDPAKPQIFASIPAYYDWIKLMTGEKSGNAIPIMPKLLYEFNDPLSSTIIKETMSGGEEKYNLLLKDNAMLSLGVLNCNGGYAISNKNLDFSMSSHTIAVKVKLNNLVQTGVGAISINRDYNDNNDVYTGTQFDSIVYNENGNDGKWMHGSESYSRSKRPLNGAQVESVSNDWIHMVAVYDVDIQTVTMYRNGEQYGDSFISPSFMTLNANSDAGDRLLFCIQYAYRTESLQGLISYGAIYDVALTSVQVKDLYQNGPFVPNVEHHPNYNYQPHLYVSTKWSSIIFGVVGILLIVNIILMAYFNCCVTRNKKRYQVVKFVSDSESDEV